MICFKDIILYAVFSNVRYGASYRDLEEIMNEWSVKVDHASNPAPMFSCTLHKSIIPAATDLWMKAKKYNSA